MSTDTIDAYLLARKGRDDLDELQRLTLDSPIIAELKALTRDQDRLIQMQTRSRSPAIHSPISRDRTDARPVLLALVR
jgi:transposase